MQDPGHREEEGNFREASDWPSKSHPSIGWLFAFPAVPPRERQPLPSGGLHHLTPALHQNTCQCSALGVVLDLPIERLKPCCVPARLAAFSRVWNWPRNPPSAFAGCGDSVANGESGSDGDFDCVPLIDVAFRGARSAHPLSREPDRRCLAATLTFRPYPSAWIEDVNAGA